MGKVLYKLFCILAFILCFAAKSFAADFDITSVVYDNSASILSINTFDNKDVTFSQIPKINIVENENKAYFDINSAVLKSQVKDIVISSSEIKQISVKQVSSSPDIVRVAISYEANYNPKNIKLLKVNNTLILRFNQPKMSNYYFQHIYSDEPASVNSYFEPLSIFTPIIKASDNILSQINSAFNQGKSSESVDYELIKNDIILPAKYYLDDVNIKSDIIHVTGVGSLTLTKPIYLQNPTRVAFDIKGAVVNSAIRNKEIQISQNETLKVGQFDQNTARIVITSNNAANFQPVIYGDAQHFVIIDKKNSQIQNLFSMKSSLNSAADEINDDKTHSMKLVFSKPVIYGIERNSGGVDIYLYNVDKNNAGSLKNSFIFEGTNLIALKDGGYKLSILNQDGDIINVHTGADGKTIRIKEKVAHGQLPSLMSSPLPPIEQIIPVKKTGKHYVVLDPGHGGADCGALRNNINEKSITLDVSKRVESLLKKKGYEVIMTRNGDDTVSLQERVDISENYNPDIFVSIHVNSSNSESPNGLETHYYKDNSLQLAKTVHASMLNNIKAENRGLFKSKFYVINHTTAPAVLVEIGFLSNPSERAQLVTESRKQATAKAIAEGIDEYFK